MSNSSHYLNNASAALMESATVDLISEYLRRESAIGAGPAAAEVVDQVAAFYSSAARLIGASSPDEIAFCDSGSRAWNVVFWGANLTAGERVVTLSSEYGTNLVSAYRASKLVGAEIIVIDCDEAGRFDMAHLERELAQGAAILAVDHIAMHGSIVNPVVDLGRLARSYDVSFVVDGCQAAGMIPVDVSAIDCDAYFTTGRKWLRGPRGTGFLYVRPGSRFAAQQVDLASASLILGDLGPTGVQLKESARQFEMWERNVACLLGLGRAVERALVTISDGTTAGLYPKAQRLRDVISANGALNLLGEREVECGIAGFYVDDPAREQELRTLLTDAEIVFTSVGDWGCPLHFPRNGVSSCLRLSPHHYTVEQSVDLAVRLLKQF